MSRDISRFRIDREKAVLVVVDVQEKLIPSMPSSVWAQTLRNIRFLVAGAEVLQVPVVATEQYPQGLGHTIDELAPACREKVVAKTSFGCCGEPAFMEHLQQLGRSQVLVVGMETHVCVQQTVLGLLERGYHVHLVRDAVISRGKVDYINALETAASAGATLTTAETALFAMTGDSRAAEFKAISTLVKNR